MESSRALTRDTTVPSALRLCCFVAPFRSGHGGCHLWVLPRSPKVPTIASHSILARTSVASSPAWDIDGAARVGAGTAPVLRMMVMAEISGRIPSMIYQ